MMDFDGIIYSSPIISVDRRYLAKLTNQGDFDAFCLYCALLYSNVEGAMKVLCISRERCDQLIDILIEAEIIIVKEDGTKVLRQIGKE